MPTEKLKILTDKEIFPLRDLESVKNWEERKTVRCIILNKREEVAFITNKVHGLYLLPGGGVEEDESLEQAARRECEEEINFIVVLNSKPFSAIEEFRYRDGKHYNTFYFSGEVFSQVLDDKRTKNEKELDIKVSWVPLLKVKELLDRQVQMVKKGEVNFYNTAFNIVRDKIFFNEFLGKNIFLEKIAKRIIEMSKKDQEMREKAYKDKRDLDISVDKENAESLKKIIKNTGWPTVSKVGKEASHMAWLLAQHADFDLEFQDSCLDLMKSAYRNNVEDVSLEDIAYLEDRVLVNKGENQKYGTQFRLKEGKLVVYPIEDESSLEKNREQMGLMPFKEYKDKILKKHK